ncbi:MAG: DEAD/DEAH box helicase, partial [bacterium]
VRGVEAAVFKEPLPIQEKAIPPAVAWKDVVGCAQTGTGKTAAYLLPMFQRFLDTKEGAEPAWGPRGLVLVPTRELAAQVAGCVKDYGRFLSLRAALVIGGVNFEPQVKALRHHPDLVIATPGRLLDQMGRGNVKFDSLQVLVLDEADRMLDMGFAKELDRILDRLPRKKQTMLFSATIPPEIESLCRGHLRNPVTVEVGQRAAPAIGIRHAVYPVPRHAKRALLSEILRRGQITTSVLIFTRTKRGADRLGRSLSEHGRRVAVLHADRSQSQRDAALADFKAGRSQFLVATDIAARGLDVEGITHVINYDVPGHPEEYVHRVGRTARVDAESRADRFREAL